MACVLLVAPWGPPALTFARSARRHGFAVHLLQATAQSPSTWAISAVQGSTTIPAKLVRTGEGLARIAHYAHDLGASALVAIVDQELLWLAEHRQAFEPRCRVLVQTADSLFLLQSKRYQIDVARQAGLSVLPTWVLTAPEDASAVPADGFPVVLRPDRQSEMSRRFKARFIASRDALKAFLDQVRGGPLIAQPFRSLPNLLVHGARSTAGDVIDARCYLVPRKFEGMSMVVEPHPFPDGLRERCEGFARLAGITGCYHFEFLYSPSDSRAHFLEVNVRLGGTTDKVTRTGFDEPSLLLQAYGVIPPTPPLPIDRHVRRVVNKRSLLKHIMVAASGGLTELDYPNMSRAAHVAHSVRDLIVASDSTFDRRDVSGCVRFFVRGLTS